MPKGIFRNPKERARKITLCKECHKEFHKIYGIKNYDKKDLKEFFNYGQKKDNIPKYT